MITDLNTAWEQLTSGDFSGFGGTVLASLSAPSPAGTTTAPTNPGVVVRSQQLQTLDRMFQPHSLDFGVQSLHG